MMNDFPDEYSMSRAKVPPQNIEAEESLLGCALSSEDARSKISDLKKEDFYQRKNGLIFQAIIDKRNLSEAVDILSIADHLESQGVLEAIGGFTYLTALVDKTFLADNVREYVRIIKEKSRLRSLLTFVQKLETSIYSGQITADSVLDQMAQKVIDSKDDITRNDLIILADILNDTLSDLRHSDKEEHSIDSGFPGLNNMLGNLRRQTLNIIAARPAMGKSAFALNLALNVALKDKVVAIFSLEMSRNEVAIRLLTSSSTVPSQRLKQSLEFTDSKDSELLSNAVNALLGTKIYIDDSASTSPADIRSKCQKLKAQVGNLDLIVIDYLQLIGSGGYSQNRQQEISEISRSLKIMARDLDVPVIALSQLSRSVEARENKRPMLSDLRESGAIEQDADAVMFLYRESYYESEQLPPVPDESELIIAKNRQGQTGTIKLNWFAEITTFREKDFRDFEAPPSSYSQSPNFEANNDFSDMSIADDFPF